MSTPDQALLLVVADIKSAVPLVSRPRSIYARSSPFLFSKANKGGKMTSPVPQLAKNLLKNPPKVRTAGCGNGAITFSSNPPSQRATHVRTAPPRPFRVAHSPAPARCPRFKPPVFGEEGCLRVIDPAVTVAVGLPVLPVVTAVTTGITALGRFQ